MLLLALAEALLAALLLTELLATLLHALAKLAPLLRLHCAAAHAGRRLAVLTDLNPKCRQRREVDIARRAQAALLLELLERLLGLASPLPVLRTNVEPKLRQALLDLHELARARVKRRTFAFELRTLGELLLTGLLATLLLAELLTALLLAELLPRLLLTLPTLLLLPRLLLTELLLAWLLVLLPGALLLPGLLCTGHSRHRDQQCRGGERSRYRRPIHEHTPDQYWRPASPGMGPPRSPANSRAFDVVPRPEWLGFHANLGQQRERGEAAADAASNRSGLEKALFVRAETAYLQVMSRQRRIILLTGFGPFPGVPENASSDLVPELAAEARKRWPDHHVEAAILPTEWRAGPAAVSDLLVDLKPMAALHFGVSSQARGFAIESRGHNFARPVTDAVGLLPSSEKLSPGGPALLAARFPAYHIVERLRRRSVPVTLSRDAGGYLCNAVLYHSLDRARRADWPMRSGFIHLPAALGGREGPEYAAADLDWNQAMEGGIEIIAATLRQPPDR